MCAQYFITCVANNELIDLDAQSCEGYIINSIHSLHMQWSNQKPRTSTTIKRVYTLSVFKVHTVTEKSNDRLKYI